jgi:hypothetical protein
MKKMEKEVVVMKQGKRTLICSSMAVVLLFLTGLTGCQPSSPAQKDTSPLIMEAEAAAFAPYREVPVNLKPSVAPYRVDADLGNVTNKDRFIFSDESKRLLVKNGFVVVPASGGNSSASMKLIAMIRFQILLPPTQCCIIITCISAICCEHWRKTCFGVS